MRLSRSVLPLATTATVAAALFGGGAVHTAFTSSANGTLSANTASIGTTLANGNVSLTNAIPGDTTAPQTVTITNQGSTPETLAATFGGGSNATLDNVVDVIWNGQDMGTLASVENDNADFIAGGVLQPGQSTTVQIQLELDNSATDADANLGDSISYTITGTAVDASAGQGNTVPPTGWDRVTNKSNL